MDEVDDDYFHSASHAEQMMLKMDAYFDKQQVLLILTLSYHCYPLFTLLLFRLLYSYSNSLLLCLSAAFMYLLHCYLRTL